jgi:hypothetical protein
MKEGIKRREGESEEREERENRGEKIKREGTRYKWRGEEKKKGEKEEVTKWRVRVKCNTAE